MFPLNSLPRLVFICLLCLHVSTGSRAQDFNYIHYDTHDGLAGSSVYSMCQDRDGFIWLGTETGLSRFDGNHFRTYTVDDGLPSNEIFGFYADRRNRVWMNCLKNTVCYFYKERIHNQQNDPVLRQVHLRDRITAMAELQGGEILLYSTRDTVLIGTSGEVESLSDWMKKHSGRQLLRYKGGMGLMPAQLFVPLKGTPVKDPFLLLKKDGGGTKPGPAYYLTDRAVKARVLFHINSVRHSSRLIRKGKDVAAADWLNSHQLTFAQPDGGIVLCEDSSLSPARIYLKEYIVQHGIEDTEHNLWFSTKGFGIFKLPPQRFKSYTFARQEVRAVFRMGNMIGIGTDHEHYWLLPPLMPADFSSGTGQKPQQVKGSPALLHALRKEVYINYAGSDFLHYNLAELHGSFKTLHLSQDTMLIASSSKCFTMTASGQVLQLIYSGRTTCAVRVRDTFYIGTLNGLYRVHRLKQSNALSKPVLLLRQQINQIATGRDGLIWVSTSGPGITGIRNNQENIVLTPDSEISGLITSCIYAQDSFLWAGTNKGLFKYDIRPGRYHLIRRLTEADGLNSDEVNTIYVEGSIVYAGTRMGMTVFDEHKLSTHANCRLVLEKISVSGKSLPPLTTQPLVLDPKENNIRFQYSCISFLSSGDIRYSYRLLGLEEDWHSTRETILSYPHLPSGSYKLQLKAVTRFNDSSGILEYPFEIRKTFTEQVWFRALVLLMSMGFAALTVRYRINLKHRKERQQLVASQRMMELEQMALRAQMNPHFIFNCLNSLQKYMMDKDEQMVNFYLSRFAALIRQTLDNSSHIYISLGEEIAYLENYLELERCQLTRKFSYQVEVDKRIDLHVLKVPNMVLQPYVENAIRHGVRKLKEQGMIRIRFHLDEEKERLECTVEDNGPGINTMNRPIPEDGHFYQSKGMAITDRRISLINQLSEHERKVAIDITDLREAGTNRQGTRVLISFPILHPLNITS